MPASFSDSIHRAARPVSGNRNTRRVGTRAAMDEIKAAFGASRITNKPAKKRRTIRRPDALVLNHIVDGFADHLGRTDEPDFEFALETFDDDFMEDNYETFDFIKDYSGYESEEDGLGRRFKARVMCDYDINNRTVVSEYFAIDNIYFEALSYTKEGFQARNHGISWMKIYLSKQGLDQFVSKFEEEVGWGIKDSLFYTDDEQGLVSLPVSFDEEDPPVWTNLVLPDGNGNENDEEPGFGLEEWGTVPEVMRPPIDYRSRDRRGIYLGTGIFTMSFRVVADGATVETLEAIRDDREYDWGSPLLGRIDLRLVGTRVIREDTRVLPLT